jgi:3-dehydroquinate synthase
MRQISNGGDPFERGSARPLDFGHWAAHKLEQTTDHRLGHGEAVGIGIALDTTYSHLAGFLPEAAWRRILDLLMALGVQIYAPELDEHFDAPQHDRCLLGGLSEFQEHLGGRLTIMLLNGIGEPFDVHEIDASLVARSIAILKGLAVERSASSAQKAS